MTYGLTLITRCDTYTYSMAALVVHAQDYETFCLYVSC